MTEHYSIERLNDAVDGLLSSAERDALDEHVGSCDACRQEYARVSEVVEAVRSLPASAATPPELWQGIAERIEGTDVGADGNEADVLPLPTARPVGRRFSLSVPQLAAAALLVSLLSAGLVWTTTGGGLVGSDVIAGSDEGPSSRVVRAANARYEEVVSDLQVILEQGRTILSPETLVTIEQSLATVDAAIAEIEVALQEDPNSDLLLRMLSSHQRTKLGVLQRAADAVRAQI